jgi:hypothetical protein
VTGFCLVRRRSLLGGELEGQFRGQQRLLTNESPKISSPAPGAGNRHSEQYLAGWRGI